MASKTRRSPMPKAKYRLALTQEEREELEAIVTKGKHNAQKVLKL